MNSHCLTCDKRNSSLCGACRRITNYNHDFEPIGYNSNHIESIPDEY